MEYLGTITGTVLPGRGEGRDFGFRTANLEVAKAPVPEGVYSAWATVRGQRYKAAVSVGVSPLFKDETRANVEANIIDFDENIYGEEIQVEFVEFLRPMIKFASTADLIETVKANIEYCKISLSPSAVV